MDRPTAEALQGTVTRLLVEAGRGHRDSLNQLFPLVYEELRLLARAQLRGWRNEKTLNTTALLHEAYLKLVDQTSSDWRSRGHFRAVAAKAMRHILIDHARGRGAAKRGGGRAAVSLEGVSEKLEAKSVWGVRDVELLLALDDALGRLEKLSERQGQIIELRYFGGLTVDEIAETMGISPATVKRGLSLAQAWLYRAIEEGGP
jgi:RNA polymerase sigma factor (TIGR02999 family)